MSNPARSRPLSLLLVTVVAAAVLVVAYQLMFTVYMLYDDEGYVLYSLANFGRYGRLYDQVYSQYGPLFFILWGGIARLGGLEWSHDLGRLITLFNWWAAAGLCGLITARLTRSVAAALLAFILAFVHLWQMTSEPMHPGGTVALLLALAAFGTVDAILRERLLRVVLIAGITGAALGLIKVNVGVFFLGGSALWLWLHRGPRVCPGRLWTWAGILAAAGMPPLLMGRYLGEPWAGHYAAITSLAILTMAGVTQRQKQDLFDGRLLASGLAGAGLLALGTFALTLASGTTLQGLADGALLGPLRHANAYHFGFNWRPGSLALAGLSAAGAWLWWRPGNPVARARAEIVIAGLRLLLVAGFIACGFAPQPPTLAYAMTLAATTAWLCAVPLQPGPSGLAGRARTWLGLILVWQYLHAYPVAGSQIGWGTFLWVPLLAVGADEAVDRLAGLAPAFSRRIARGTRIALLAGALVLLGYHARLGAYYLKISEPVGLRGATLLQLPPAHASMLRIMCRNAEAHADVLFSLPGIYSFNLWTDLPTPNQTDATHWFTLLSTPQQEGIKAALEAARNPVLIVHPMLVFSHLRPGFGSAGLLEQYVSNEFTPVFGLGPLSIWLRNGRQIAVLDSAALFGSRTAGDAEPRMISVVALVPPGRAIASVEVVEFAGDELKTSPALNWSAANTRVEMIPIDLRGHPRGPQQPDSGWPVRPAGLTRLNFYPRCPLPPAPLERIWLRLLDGTGRMIGEARFIHQGEELPGVPAKSPAPPRG